MDEQKKIIEELILSNEKLSAIAQLYDNFYLTKEEKVECNTQINKAENSNEIKDAFTYLSKKFNSSYHFSSDEARWSPGVIREFLKYYENQVSFNPVERLRKPFAILKAFFELKLNEEKLDELGKNDLKNVVKALPSSIKMIKDIFEEVSNEEDDFEDEEDDVEMIDEEDDVFNMFNNISLKESSSEVEAEEEKKGE